MSDEVKLTTVPLAGFIRLEQQRDRYREALEEIARWDITTNGQWCASAEAMQKVAAAALKGAMSGGSE